MAVYADASKFNDSVLSYLDENLPWWFWRRASLRWMREYVASPASHQWFTYQGNFVGVLRTGSILNGTESEMVDMAGTIKAWVAGFRLDSPWWVTILDQVMEFLLDHMETLIARLRLDGVFDEETVIMSLTWGK